MDRVQSSSVDLQVPVVKVATRPGRKVASISCTIHKRCEERKRMSVTFAMHGSVMSHV